MNLKTKIKLTWLDISYLPLIITAGITIVVVYIVYNQTQLILKERLRERLISIASTAALQIPAQDVIQLQKKNDIKAVELSKIVRMVRSIRDVNKNLKYIYIWSKTSDPNYVTFTVDAEMLSPIDRDQNGQIEGIEIPPSPGESYDISELPKVQEAFSHPTAQEDFLVDKWGTFLSGFAPIYDDQGRAVAILGIDVEVSDYYTLVRATFIPFVLLTILLLLFLTIQTISLMRIWRNRINLVQELDRQKDELLSIVSHQLATPITSFKWYVEMLMDGDLGKITPEQTTHISSMKSIAADLADLVSMILDVSRIQLGRVKIEKQSMDVNQFYKEILEVMNPKAAEKGVKFRVNVPTNLPTMNLDKRYTRMTIENLISNAIKYTPKEGTVTFNVVLKVQKMYVEVADTGMGIPKADQDKIFGKLFRASNVRNSVDGNGFGLYIAKGAVEAQGGKISFKSEEGKGTTFYVELPVK